MRSFRKIVELHRSKRIKISVLSITMDDMYVCGLVGLSFQMDKQFKEDISAYFELNWNLWLATQHRTLHFEN